MKQFFIFVASTAIMASSAIASAEIVRLDNSKITSVLINDGGSFGGCMAQVDIDVSSFAPDCNNGYVTFDCNGDFQDPAVGNRFLEMAQVAYVTGKEMRFSIDTNLQHNGFCVATRADLK